MRSPNTDTGLSKVLAAAQRRWHRRLADEQRYFWGAPDKLGDAPARASEGVSTDPIAAQEREALALYEQGKYAAAEAVLREVCAGRARQLGADHPHVLIVRSQHARLLAL